MIDEQVLILRPERVCIHSTARIDRWVKIEGGEGVTIGLNVHVASFSHINGGGGQVVLADHCGLASGVKVIGAEQDLTYRALCPMEPPGSFGVIRRRTEIGEYALLCTNCVILPGVTVGRGAVVAAGAVVTKDVDPWTIVAGVPAKPIGVRTLREEDIQAEDAALIDYDWVGV